jgi:hypothetical protein
LDTIRSTLDEPTLKSLPSAGSRLRETPGTQPRHFAHAAAAGVLAASGTFNTLALGSGAAFCIVYIACCAAAWQLQRAAISETSDPLRLPGGALIPAVAITCLILVLLAVG